MTRAAAFFGSLALLASTSGVTQANPLTRLYNKITNRPSNAEKKFGKANLPPADPTKGADSVREFQTPRGKARLLITEKSGGKTFQYIVNAKSGYRMSEKYEKISDGFSPSYRIGLNGGKSYVIEVEAGGVSKPYAQIQQGVEIYNARSWNPQGRAEDPTYTRSIKRSVLLGFTSSTAHPEVHDLGTGQLTGASSRLVRIESGQKSWPGTEHASQPLPSGWDHD